MNAYAIALTATLLGLLIPQVSIASADLCKNIFEHSQITPEMGKHDDSMSNLNPGWKVYRLGKGDTATVYRFVSEKDSSKAFVRKVYEREELKQNDLKAFDFLNSLLQTNDLPGVRVVKISRSSEPKVLDLEWIPGQTIDLVQGLSVAEKQSVEARYALLSQKLRDTLANHEGMEYPISETEWGFMFKKENFLITLKKANLVIDAKSLDLVFIDPF